MGIGGTQKTVNSFVEFERRFGKPAMMDIYVQALKEQGKYKHRSEKKIREILQFHMNLKEEVYLTAKEAIAWGFADEIFDGKYERLRRYYKKHKARG